MKFLLLLLLLPFYVSASEVFRCEVDGKVTYSQFKCGDGAEKVTYKSSVGKKQHEEPDVASALNNDRSSTEAINKEINEFIAKQDLQRRIEKLKKNKRAVAEERDLKIQQLKISKKFSNNNLAGATWQESLSKEMQAVATQYGTDITSIDREIDRLSDELSKL